MYLGRQPISQAPYLCIASALAWYLSAGFTGAALRVPIWSRGSSRGFGASLGTATLLRAVLAKHRTMGAAMEEVVGRKAEAKVLLLQSLLAMVGVGGLKPIAGNQPVPSVEYGCLTRSICN